MARDSRGRYTARTTTRRRPRRLGLPLPEVPSNTVEESGVRTGMTMTLGAESDAPDEQTTTSSTSSSTRKRDG